MIKIDWQEWLLHHSFLGFYAYMQPQVDSRNHAQRLDNIEYIMEVRWSLQLLKGLFLSKKDAIIVYKIVRLPR